MHATAQILIQATRKGMKRTLEEAKRHSSPGSQRLHFESLEMSIVVRVGAAGLCYFTKSTHCELWMK